MRCYDEIFRVLNCRTSLQGDVAPDKGIITTLDHSASIKASGTNPDDFCLFFFSFLVYVFKSDSFCCFHAVLSVYHSSKKSCLARVVSWTMFLFFA